MNGVQTRFKCKLDVKRCKRFVFPPSSLLPRSNALKTKAIRYFQTDRTLTRIVSPPLYGNDVYNATRMFNTQSQDERSNQLAEVADRWTPTNASNRVPSAKGYVKYELYSRFVEDGSFLRLKNVTLGYTLPNKWTKKAYINRLRVYGTAQNLFCLTKYSGYDPEVNMKSSPLMPGFDWGAYPKSRVFTFGVEVQF